jgi:hypothetical protein
MGKITRVLWRISLVILLLVLFIITLVVVSLPIFKVVDGRFKEEVINDIPRLFPILVITPSKEGNDIEGQIIYKEKLDEFLANNREYTFLVPQGQAEKLNQVFLQKCRMRTGGYDWDSPIPWYEYFKVKQVENNRQQLEVFCTWDDDRVNVGWYETDGKEIFPKFYKFYFGPGVCFIVLPLGFAANVFIWGIGLYFYKRYRKRRLATAQTH